MSCFSISWTGLFLFPYFWENSKKKFLHLFIYFLLLVHIGNKSVCMSVAICFLWYDIKQISRVV